MPKRNDNSSSYGESEGPLEKQKPLPIPAPGIGSRIGRVADLVGTRISAANAADVSADSLQRYIREENMPPFDAMARLCLAAGVRMEWLATGDGQMTAGVAEVPASQGFAKPSQPTRPAGAPMDSGLLAAAIRVTEDVLREFGLRDRVGPDQAELVRVVYEDLARGAAQDAASETLHRILTIARMPQSLRGE